MKAKILCGYYRNTLTIEQLPELNGFKYLNCEATTKSWYLVVAYLYL
jgi:hypothetical protein